MRIRGLRRRAAAALPLAAAGFVAGAGGLPGPVEACQVPVFRYALERWEADEYRAVVTHRGGLAPGGLEALAHLRRDGGEGEPTVNLAVEVVDLADRAEAAAGADLFAPAGPPPGTALPLLELFFPEDTGIEEPFWSVPLTVENAQRVLASPARRELVRRILGGDSTVWVLIGNGQPEHDRKAEADLRRELSAAAAGLKIPDGVVDLETFQARGLDPAAGGGAIDLDDVLRSPIPLRVAFSILTVDRGAPEEAVFLRQLLARWPHMDPGQPAGEAVAFPVFGRGRALEGVPAGRFSGGLGGPVRAACSYLCGACSCQVKSENPGIDLLVSAGWGRAASVAPVVVERGLPPLEGAGILARATGATPTPDTPPESAGAAAPVSPPPGSTAHSLAPSAVSRRILVVSGLLLAGLGLATAFVLARR